MRRCRKVQIGLDWLRVGLLFGLASGCAKTSEWALFARTPEPLQRTALKGRTIGVLPAMIVGCEASRAVYCTEALERILSGNIMGARYSGPLMLLPICRANRESLSRLQQAVTVGLPSDWGPVGKAVVLLDRRAIGGEDFGWRAAVTLREYGAGSVAALTPEMVDPGMLRPYGVDYVLVSVAYSYYWERTGISALYGILPFVGTVRLYGCTPRAVFALYESLTGKRVWESCIGVDGSARGTDEPYAIDARKLPALGAAYMLTGDIEIPIARLFRKGAAGVSGAP